MSESRSLEQVLADAREDAAILRRNGHPAQADTITHLCDAAGEAALEYLTWLSDEEAHLRSGFSLEWLRARFPAWQEQGHARLDVRRRLYRMLIIPRRARIEEARARGRERGRAA